MTPQPGRSETWLRIILARLFEQMVHHLGVVVEKLYGHIQVPIALPLNKILGGKKY